MKIAVVHNTAPGGSKRALFEHLCGLAARGHELHAFLPAEAEETYLPIQPLCVSYRVYGVELRKPTASEDSVKKREDPEQGFRIPGGLWVSGLSGEEERGEKTQYQIPNTPQATVAQYLPPLSRGGTQTIPSDSLSDGRLTPANGLRQVVQQALGEDLYEVVRDWVWVRRQQRLAQDIAGRYRQMAGDIARSGCDVVYVHQCMVRLAPDVLRFVQNIPTVFYVQDTLRRAHEWPAEPFPDYDTFSESFLRKKWQGRIGTEILHGWRRREDNDANTNLRLANIVLVNSFYSREAFLRTSGLSARVNYLGVNTDFFCPEKGGYPLGVGEKEEVLSVGALRPEKRHEFILAAIAQLPSVIRPRLRIIGYGLSDGKGGRSVTSQALYEQAEKSGVELVIDAEVTDERLREAYRRASVFAFAPRLEPFGLVVLEAMACGLPVVAVREAGPRETVRDGETGFLTEATPEAFAHALQTLLTDPDRARQMGENARRDAVAHWTWERSVAEVEEILYSVVRSV